jgi:hypothetical protein
VNPSSKEDDTMFNLTTDESPFGPRGQAYMAQVKARQSEIFLKSAKNASEIREALGGQPSPEQASQLSRQIAARALGATRAS